MCLERIPCNRYMEWIPGGYHTQADCRERVLGSYGIVDRPSDHIYVWTILVSGCMDISSHKKRFKIIQYNNKHVITISKLVEAPWLTRHTWLTLITCDHGSELISNKIRKYPIEK